MATSADPPATLRRLNEFRPAFRRFAAVHPVRTAACSAAARARERFDVEPTLSGLRLLGELDVATAPVLESAYDVVRGTTELRVDVAGLDFIDAFGTRTLLAPARAAVDLVIASPSGIVARVFDLLRITAWPRVRIEDGAFP